MSIKQAYSFFNTLHNSEADYGKKGRKFIDRMN